MFPDVEHGVVVEDAAQHIAGLAGAQEMAWVA
jgi:hypothetical protein